MDLTTMLVDAVALGAMTGLKETTSLAVKDAYKAFKGLLSGRYAEVSASGVESKPDSPAQRIALRELLGEAGAGEDTELLAAAKQLLEAIKADAPDAAEAIGVDLSAIEAVNINIENIIARKGSIGIRAKDISATGDVTIRGVDAGAETANP
jgi:hypothetical protein